MTNGERPISNEEEQGLAATVPGPGEGGSEAADNHQDSPESAPNQCDFWDGSEMLRQG
jgi:hypothetical protein